MIWFLGGVVALLAIGGLAAPWWLPAFAQRRTLRRHAANVAAYRTRLQELEADIAGGVLAPDAAETVRQELGSRLLKDVDALVEPQTTTAPSRAVLLMAALALLAFGGVWYAVAGGWRTQALIELARTDPEAARQASLNQSIARLRERVQDAPEEVESWVWLARSYRTRGNYSEAAAAFGKANDLRGHQDPDLLVEEGEAIAFAQDRSMEGLPSERFSQALVLAPGHPQALWYAGIAAMQAGDDAAAIHHWEQLQRQEISGEMRSVIEHSLAQLRGRTGQRAPQAAAAAPVLRLEIEVSVAPGLVAEVGPGDTLFVFAQDAAGPPMPLAVQRLRAADLPLQTTLDDSNSMTPARRLSSVDRWRLVARISRAGNAMPQPGDLEGAVEVGRADAAGPIRVLIDKKR